MGVQISEAADVAAPRKEFRVGDIDSCPVRTWVLARLFDYPLREWLLRFVRRLFPIVRLGGILWVLRDEDVRQVLGNSAAFPVPWNARMMHATGHRNFVLGMAPDAEYRRSYEQLARAFEREDVARYVVPQSARATERILRGKTRIDGVRELMWGVPAILCREYYGLDVHDHLLVADWSVAISSYLFTPGRRKPAEQEKPKEGSPEESAIAGMRELIRRSIRQTRGGGRHGVVLPRMIELGFTDQEIEAHMMGMVVGFIPTNLLAGGNILDSLLRFPRFMGRTRAAAFGDDDDVLWRCLQETLRFRHINPGPLRECGPEGYRLAAGTRRETYIAPGTPVLASTQSAMFDPARVTRPREFNPDRPADDYMVFGYGQHWCIGAFIAIGQITQTFKILLRREGLRRAPGSAGQLKRFAVYPAHLEVEFRP
jgi:cytochrome P450